ncbi:hypothetical protein BSKO_00602 [Bryopsis sp. KO-2023]|nr:hypothetical protein BSKO_00602 [Bryopsis sp. KO-2023]
MELQRHLSSRTATSTHRLSDARLSCFRIVKASTSQRRVKRLRCSAERIPDEYTLPDVAEFLPLLEKKRQEGRVDGPGCVYLVGTGPGDPGLLTLRAVHLMQSADVVLYDRLVSDDIMRMVHDEARMIYVGKNRSFHTRTQTEIHQLMMQFAERGALVLRLKGGDPYIFGRGGEELLYLQERGIPVRCIPGITAASGISAELGVPLTHRGVATTVRFLTGHSREGGEEDLDETIAKSVDPMATLVVYMGLHTLPSLVKRLVRGGQSVKTPAVAIERGTTIDQRMVYGCLDELAESVKQAELVSPTLIIIGDVVGLSPGWKRYQGSGCALQEGSVDSFLPKGIDFMGTSWGENLSKEKSL